MGGINRIPEGLLDLLSSKTDGKNPQFLSETVAGVLRMEPFYFADQTAHAFFTFTQSVPGSNFSTSVPAGELWLLFAADIEWIAQVAGTTVSSTLVIERIPLAVAAVSSVVIHDVQPQTAVAIGDVVTSSKVFDRVIPLSPGVVLRVITGSASAAAPTSVNFLYYRLNL